jgi:hypothetical protein
MPACSFRQPQEIGDASHMNALSERSSNYSFLHTISFLSSITSPSLASCGFRLKGPMLPVTTEFNDTASLEFTATSVTECCESYNSEKEKRQS